MMARCKLNPCCGETMPGKCRPPPQFRAGESYAEYEARTTNDAPAPAPSGSGVREADAYLKALLDYSGGFYSAAIEHGMKPGPAADAVQHIERAARNLHRLASDASPRGEAVVTLKTMRLSDGRADYFVSIRQGDREVTPHVFREEYKAAYHVALYHWLLCGGEEPDLVAFGPDDWPAVATAHPAPATVEMTCDQMLAEAGRLAGQIGYMVVPDPVHADGEVHAPEFVLQVQPSLRALGFHAVPLDAALAPATEGRKG